MPSPSKVCNPYDNSYFGGSIKPPPPPPKPGSQDIRFTNTSQSFTPQSIQEISTSFNNGSNADTKLAEFGQLHGTVNPPQDQDPGEEWLPKMLESKSKQQLTEILENPKLLSALANSSLTVHPSISVYQSFLEDVLKENITLASHLKEVETRLVQLRTTTQTQLLATHALERQWRQKQSDMDQALAPFAPPSLYQNLSQAVQEEEQICSSLETSFLESDGVASEKEVTEWVRKFRESRKLYFSRLSKKERWDEGRIGGWR